MTTDLITRARDGDEDAFRALAEPHRRELHVHCYRMLGSVQDAEDALQDTMLAAWRGLGGFDERASFRTWLYRIATNTCLNAVRARRRRPAVEWQVPEITPPEPTRNGEVPWLGPLPDPLFEGAFDVPVGPEARYEQIESISLAFVAALQVLPPRQLAVLVLRDVLGFRAAETAAMLDTTVAAANSALARARERLEEERARWPAGELAPVDSTAAEDEIVGRFVRAYEAFDIPALVELFTDDVYLSMPPLPFEYHGRDAAAAFLRAVGDRQRGLSFVPTRANARPALGVYAAAPDGSRQAWGLFALTVTADGIAALTRFEPNVLPWFGLPESLPAAGLSV